MRPPRHRGAGLLAAWVLLVTATGARAGPDEGGAFGGGRGGVTGSPTPKADGACVDRPAERRCANVGTVMFRASDAAKQCWTEDSVLLLQARWIAQSLVPRGHVDPRNDSYVRAFVEYVTDCFETTRRLARGLAQQMMVLTLADVFGGYLRHYLLPVTRDAFYAGTIRYAEAAKLFKLYEELKAVLRTDGSGWVRPSATRRDRPRVCARPLALKAPAAPTGADERARACADFITYEAPASDRTAPPEPPTPPAPEPGDFAPPVTHPNGCPCVQCLVQRPFSFCGVGGTTTPTTCAPPSIVIPIPFLDDNKQPHSIAVPLKTLSLHSLESACSQSLVAKYYVAAMRCLMAREVPQAEILDFNRQFKRWLVAAVVPHVRRDAWYPAFGGVLRVLETMRLLGLEAVDVDALAPPDEPSPPPNALASMLDAARLAAQGLQESVETQTKKPKASKGGAMWAGGTAQPSSPETKEAGAGAATVKFQALRRFFSRGGGGSSSSSCTAEASAPAPTAYAPAASTAGDVGSQEEQSGATPTPPLKPGRKTTPRAASKLTAHLKPLPGTRGPSEAGPQPSPPPGSLPVPQPGEQPGGQSGSTSGGQAGSQPGRPTERQSAGVELMKGVFGAAAWGRSPDMLMCVLLGLAAAVAVWLLGSILFVCLKLRGGRRDAGRAAASHLAGPRGGPGGPDAYPELLGDTDRPADGRHPAKMRHEARAPPRRRRWWPCGHRRSPTDHDCPVCLEGAELPCPHRPAEPSSSAEEAEQTSSAVDSRSDLDSHPSREGGICGWMSSLFASCAAKPGAAGVRAGGAGDGGGAAAKGGGAGAGGAPKRTCRCECGGDGRNCCWRTTCCGGDRVADEPCTPEHKCGLGDCYGQCGAAGPGGRGQRPPPSSTSATSEELATVRLGSAPDQEARGKVSRFVDRPGAAGPPHPPAAGKQAAGVESRPSSGATEAPASPSEAESAPQSSTDARWRSSRAAEGSPPLASPRRTLDPSEAARRPRDAARPSQSRGTEGAADARRARHSEPPSEARRSQGAEPRRSHRNPEPTSEARRFQEGEPRRSHRHTRDSEPTTEARRTRHSEPHESHRHARESDPTAGPRRTRTSDPLERSTEALDAELPGSMRRRPENPMRSLAGVQEPPGSGRTQGLDRDLTARPEEAQLPGSAEQSRRSGPPENSRRMEILAVIPESPAARNSRMQAPEDEFSGTRRPQKDSEFKDPNAEPLESDKQHRHSQRASVTKAEDSDSAETTRPSRGSIKFARPLESGSQKSTDYEPSVNQSRKSRDADTTTDPERRRKSRDSASGEPSRKSRDDSAPSINPTRKTREPETLDRPKQPSTSEGSPGPQRRESAASRRAGSESPKPLGGPGAAADRRSGTAPRESADRKSASAPDPRWDQNVMTAQTTAQILYAPTSMAPTWKSTSQSPSPSPSPPPPSRASSSAAKRRSGTSADRPISPRWR